MSEVLCPDCSQMVDVPDGVKIGERFECPNCAGTWLRLVRGDGGIEASTVALVSCPNCESMLEVPQDAKPGDHMVCCGRTYRLTYAYDAWALEELQV